MTIWSFLGAVVAHYVVFGFVIAFVVGDVLPKDIWQYHNGRHWRLVIAGLVYVTLRAGVALRS